MTLLSAPHRAFFLLGAVAFVGVIAWWLAVLRVPLPVALPGSRSHAWLVVYGVALPYIAGFLFTAYSRWLAAPAPSPALWRSTLAFAAAGTGLFVAGTHLGAAVALAGAGAWIVAWLLLVSHCLAAVRAGDGAALHAWSMLGAALAGLAALALLAASLWLGDARFAAWGLAVAFWGHLLGVFLVVAHRMVPFFAGCVLRPYTPYRPAWVLLTMLALAAAHAGLEVLGAPRWLWLVDAPFALLAAWLAVRWQWRRAFGNRLLSALFIAWGGLVAGLAASTAKHAALHFTGEPLGGPWPEHLVGIGFFGAMIIAMGTRVALGHSGRALVMGRVAWWALLCLVAAALLRAGADFTLLRREALLASAALWVGAGVAWLAVHWPMLVRPRVDGRAG